MRRFIVLMGMLLGVSTAAAADNTGRLVVYSGEMEGAQIEAARVAHEYHLNGGSMSYRDLEDLAFPGEHGLIVHGAKTWHCSQKEMPSYIDDLIEKAVSHVDELELAKALEALESIVERLACAPDRQKIGKVMFLLGYVSFINGDAMAGIHYFEYAAAADSEIQWDKGYAPEAGDQNIKGYFDEAKASADRARRGISVFQRPVEIVPETASITIEGMYSETKIPVPGMLTLTWDNLGVERKMLAMVDAMNPVTIITRSGFEEIMREGPTGGEMRDEIVLSALSALGYDTVTVVVMHEEKQVQLYTWSNEDPENPFHIHLPEEAENGNTDPVVKVRSPFHTLSVSATYMPIGPNHFTGFSLWGDVGFKRGLGLRLHIGGGLGLAGDSDGYFLYMLPYVELGPRWVFDPAPAPNLRIMVGGHLLLGFQNAEGQLPIEAAGLGCGGLIVKPNARPGLPSPPNPFFEVCGGGGSITGMLEVRVGIAFGQ